MTRSTLALLLVLLFPAHGCGSDGANDPAQPLVPSNGTHLLVTLQRAPRSILSGGSVEIVVAVARDGNDAFDGDVDVALAPAEGFSAPPVTLARETSVTKLTIAVTPERLHGDVPLRIVATSKDRIATGDAPLVLQVRGQPGTLDTSFAKGGIFTLGEASAEATGMVVQPDGKIVLGGRIGGDAAVVRLDPLGRLDTSFATTGKARTKVPGLVSTHDPILLRSGDIVLGGTGPVSSVLVAFTSAGAPDAKLGNGGVLVSATQARSSALVFADEGMYLGGQSSSATDKNALHIERVLANGAKDTSWGRSGAVVLPFAPATCALGDGECFVSAMNPKVGGRLTVCASLGNGVALRQLFPSGIEDLNWALTTPGDVLSRCTGIINNTPDDFWAAGARDSNAFQMLHFKVSPTGGPVEVDIYAHPPVIPPEAGIGPATRFIYGAFAQLVASADATPNGGPSQMALVRVNGFTLQLDPTFGGKGYVMTQVGTTPSKTRALVVQPDGRLIVAGTNGDMVAARYWP